MNIRLHTLLQDAESRLALSDQERLAALVEAFVMTHDGQVDFSPAEMEYLQLIDAEPFQSVDPLEIERLFARRG